MNERPKTATVMRAVGWVTFSEIIHDKILYNIVLCAFVLLSLGFFASQLTFVRPERVVLDFGFSSLALSSSLIGMFVGATLLVREFDHRTAFVALSHPISRAQFILGKFAGVAAVLATNCLLLSLVYLFLLSISSDQGMRMISGALIAGLFLVFVQSLMISSISMLFSTFSTTSLSIIITIGFYLAGNNVSQIRLLSSRLHSPLGSLCLNGLAAIIPNLEYFNLGSKITYGLPVTWAFISLSSLYGAFVITLLLALSGFLIRCREV
jgi:ABC-type transport system involved in multi-copper enzyme maturation permease subunit